MEISAIRRIIALIAIVVAIVCTTAAVLLAWAQTRETYSSSFELAGVTKGASCTGGGIEFSGKWDIRGRHAVNARITLADGTLLWEHTDILTNMFSNGAVSSPLFVAQLPAFGVVDNTPITVEATTYANGTSQSDPIFVSRLVYNCTTGQIVAVSSRSLIK
jgi:hypothetical protein